LVFTINNLELLSPRIGFIFPTFWAEEDGWNRKHGDDGQNFAAASHFHGLDKHFGKGRIQREFHHFPAHVRQLPRVVQSAQDPQLVHGVQQIVHWRRVHEVELQQIIDI